MVPDVVLYNMFVTYFVKYFVKYLVQADRSCRQWILSDVILHNRFVTLVVVPPCWPVSIGRDQGERCLLAVQGPGGSVAVGCRSAKGQGPGG